MLMGDRPGDLKGGRMPATTPEQIHRLLEAAFNAGDLDGLMALYEAPRPLAGDVPTRAAGGCGWVKFADTRRR
jgi:hypothetical protein